MNAQTEDTKTENEQAESQAEQAQPRSYSIPPSSFQRQQQQQQPASPVRAAASPGAYPGAYPGSSYSGKSNAESDYDSERTLTIGPGITMSGEIESCDNLVVEGTVEAALKGAKVLDIYETGTFYGTVEIEEATIAGRFEGELTVNGRLVVRQSGTLTGSISYRELEVEAGAVIDGRITPLKEQGESVQKPRPKDSAPQAPRKGEGPANTDSNGLFPERAAAE